MFGMNHHVSLAVLKNLGASFDWLNRIDGVVQQSNALVAKERSDIEEVFYFFNEVQLQNSKNSDLKTNNFSRKGPIFIISKMRNIFCLIFAKGVW